MNINEHQRRIFPSFHELSLTAQQLVLDNDMFDNEKRRFLYDNVDEFRDKLLLVPGITENDKFQIHLFVLNFNPDVLPPQQVEVLRTLIDRINVEDVAREINPDNPNIRDELVGYMETIHNSLQPSNYSDIDMNFHDPSLLDPIEFSINDFHFGGSNV